MSGPTSPRETKQTLRLAVIDIFELVFPFRGIVSSRDNQSVFLGSLARRVASAVPLLEIGMSNPSLKNTAELGGPTMSCKLVSVIGKA
jgi:hypothetical protein